MSFRNRCQIVGTQGVIDLSIPLVGGRGQKGLMRDVRIVEDRSWQQQHWKTIVTCYNRSPWFDYYRDSLEALYGQPASFLLDWNLACFDWTLRMLGVRLTVGLTETYRDSYGPEEAVDWRGRLMPRDRTKWDMARDRPEDRETGDRPAAPRYHQVFEDRIGFMPNLSILDLLFCEGKEAIRYIRSSDDGKLSGAGTGAFGS